SAAIVGDAQVAEIAASAQCDSCKEIATDVLWVCTSCQPRHRLCNKCKGLGVSGSHRLVAWPIRERTIEEGQYVVCDQCTGPVVGPRWHCGTCASFDMCNDCYNKAGREHGHALAPQYLADTAMHPRGAEGYGYTCNQCSTKISSPVLCCLVCSDFHICATCVGQGKMCTGHDHAAVALSAAATAERKVRASDVTSAREPSSSATPAPHERHYHPRASSGSHAGGLFSAVCNECSNPISGIRHRCTRCKDYDLCDGCYCRVTSVHPGHGFVHFGPPPNSPHVLAPALRHAATVLHGRSPRGRFHDQTIGHHPHQRARGHGRPGRFGLQQHASLSACRLVNPPADCTWEVGPLTCSLPPPPPAHPQPLTCVPPPPRSRPMPCNLPPLPPSEENQQQTGRVTMAERSTATEEAHSVVHPNIVCDACDFPIVGVRYKCGNCPDFDLCENCESTAQHTESHLFVKIRRPLAIPVGMPMLKTVFPPENTRRYNDSTGEESSGHSRPTLQSTGAAVAAVATEAVVGALAPPLALASAATAAVAAVVAPAPASTSRACTDSNTIQPITRSSSVVESAKYVAIFVEDVTIPDGTPMGPGESFVKIWSVANMGDSEWPKGTMLVHVDGEPSIPGNCKAAPIVVGKRYEQVGVAVDLVAPMAPGRYVSQWRLMTPEGHYFGTGLWCTIVVEASPFSDSAVLAASVPDVTAVVDTALSAASAAAPATVPETSNTTSAASSAVFVNDGADQQRDVVNERTVPSSPAASDAATMSSVASSSSSAFTSTPNDDASTESLSSTFVKIGAELMNEIRRLDQSIRVLQLRQDVLDSASRSSSSQDRRQLSSEPNASADASIHRHTPFDITATPAGSSDLPIQTYPPPPPATTSSASSAAGVQQRRYSNVDLLASPPLNSSSAAGALSPQPLLLKSPDTPHSESASMQEFYSSASRLEQLLVSSRMASRSIGDAPLPLSEETDDATDEMNDEFEMVNDFTEMDAASPKPI
ncbi:hypothetical protein GGI04_005035, partial [Coemansia thaxteri]